MKRQFRRWAGRWVRPFVPAFLRQAWGGPLYGFRPTTSPFKLENDAVSETLSFCDDQRRISLRLPAATRASLCEWVEMNGKVREEWEALMLEMRSHRILFDIGAYDGTEAMLFCAGASQNRAVIFEPAKGPMAGLTEGLRANGLTNQIVIRPVALGEKSEQRQMYLSSGEMLEIVEAAGVPEWNVEPTMIEFRRLDDECRDLQLAPDLIRMDVDACELDVLRGAEQAIATHRPTIIIEIHLDLLERRGQSARELCDLLRGHRYAFFSCRNLPLSPAQVFDAFDAVTTVFARPE